MLRQLRARGADEEDGAVHPERGAGRAEGPAARRLPAPRQAGRHRALPPGRPLSLPVGRGELVRGEKEQQGGLDALQSWWELGAKCPRTSSSSACLGVVGELVDVFPWAHAVAPAHRGENSIA